MEGDSKWRSIPEPQLMDGFQAGLYIKATSRALKNADVLDFSQRMFSFGNYNHPVDQIRLFPL